MINYNNILHKPEIDFHSYCTSENDKQRRRERVQSCKGFAVLHGMRWTRKNYKPIDLMPFQYRCFMPGYKVTHPVFKVSDCFIDHTEKLDSIVVHLKNYDPMFLYWMSQTLRCNLVIDITESWHGVDYTAVMFSRRVTSVVSEPRIHSSMNNHSKALEDLQTVDGVDRVEVTVSV
jgi:hypothetical protein